MKLGRRSRDRLRRRPTESVQYPRLLADLPFRSAPTHRRRLSLLAGVLVTALGWLVWNALLYRGRVSAQVTQSSGQPIATIRERLCDLDHWPLWQPEIPESGWLGRQQWEPGARFRWTLGRVRMVSSVQAAAKDGTLTWRSQIWGLDDSFDWHLAEVEEHTRIEARRDLAGWAVWLAGPLLQARINGTLRRWVQRLAQTSD